MIEVGSRVKLKDKVEDYLLDSYRYRTLIRRHEVYEVVNLSPARTPGPALYIKLSGNNYWYESNSFEDVYLSNLEKILT